MAHIQRLSASGFAPDRRTVRQLAYKFAEKLNLQHKFSKENEMAGKAWLQSFLDRNSELSIRQAEGLSLARAHGMNREDVNHFFTLLEQTMTEHNLFDKPSHIFNMDETGVQLINKPGKVITSKGSKDVHVLTAKEKGENVTVIACCSADGKFTPPTLILKGVNRKPEFGDGLPAGSKVYMNRKSSFINSELFLRWVREIFIPHKPFGKCLLILDGHTSHSTDIDMLHVVDENDIILLCLPSHCTQALQPLDRSFFKPFKTYFNQEAQVWIKHNANRNITRYQAGQLIGKAWLRAASVATGVNGFKATGIYPLDPNAVPDHFYSMQDISEPVRNNSNVPKIISVPPEVSDINIQNEDTVIVAVAPEDSAEHHLDQEPGTHSVAIEEFTPTKLLHDVSPIPKLPVSFNKRIKQGATVLTSTENIRKREVANQNKKTKASVLKSKLNSNHNKEKAKLICETKASSSTETWEESDDEPLIKMSKSDSECFCVECFEKYKNTKKKTTGFSV